MKRVTSAVIVVFLLAMTACANSAGDGNEFAVTGTITTVGDHSITIESITVRDARGEAADWWLEGTHQVHDNFRTCQTLGDMKKTVGRVIVDGEPSTLASLEPGDVVEVTGKIRESALRCGQRTRYGFRAVFDVVESKR